MARNWDDYREFERVIDTYMPSRGEGDTKASQLVTAINKLVYKWYNDGDVYDNTGPLTGWANDLSSYANWIYRYIPRSRKILDRVYECYNESDYEDLLWDLSNAFLDLEDVENLANESKVGSIYDCEGPYEFREEDEDEDAEYEEEEMWEDEEEDEDIESATDITAADEPKNEALEDAMSSLKDDFDFILQGLEKLERSSAEDSRMGLEIAERLSGDLQEIISAISDRF